MRFKIGELVCVLTDWESSLPVCYQKDNKFFRCHEDSDRWKPVGMFCKLPIKEPVYGYVCGYDTPEVFVLAGAEFSKQVNNYLFAMLVIKKEPVLVRMNELDQMLYRVIDSGVLEDRNGTRAELLFKL
jgi:hypothetical protein